MLPLAITLITAALAFYTAGVWTERRAGVLTWKHAALFALGLFFDITGTLTMGRIAASGTRADAGGAAGALSSVMQITGGLALLVMAAHLAWAVIVLVRQRPNELAVFHKLSLGVWLLWLIPYFTGAASASM